MAREGATATAPATVANVAVGFDVLGFAVEGIADRITVRRDGRSGVRIDSISGVVADLPEDPEHNTATAALLSLSESCSLDFGLRVSIDKGIPLGSGMGGSAASAVGAVVAANRLLPRPLPLAALMPHALAGEHVASGAAHADNVAPCLYGGLTAAVGGSPPAIVELPVPPGLRYVLVHPGVRVDTRDARQALAEEIPLVRHVEQSMRLCGFIAACFRQDVELLGRSMVDLIAEPTRAASIPGFDEIKQAAHAEGALGFGIAGSGPSVFAWAASEGTAERVRTRALEVFGAQGLEAEGWIGAVGAPGASAVDERT